MVASNCSTIRIMMINGFLLQICSRLRFSAAVVGEVGTWGGKARTWGGWTLAWGSGDPASSGGASGGASACEKSKTMGMAGFESHKIWSFPTVTNLSSDLTVFDRDDSLNIIKTTFRYFLNRQLFHTLM